MCGKKNHDTSFHHRLSTHEQPTSFRGKPNLTKKELRNMTRNVNGALILSLGIVASYAYAAEAVAPVGKAGRPRIEKLGTIDLDLVETQPIVFRDRLYRFESVRTRYEGNTLGKPYFRFVDPATGEATPAFAEGHDLGSVLVDGETMYVFGTPGWGSAAIDMLWSQDLMTWQSKRILDLPGWKLFNSSVCKADERYVMAFEVGGPPEVVGHGFTSRFAESNDLLNWKLLDEPAVFTKERYSACPTIRYEDGWFYVVYLESMGKQQYTSPHGPATADDCQSVEPQQLRCRLLRAQRPSDHQLLVGRSEGPRVSGRGVLHGHVGGVSHRILPARPQPPGRDARAARPSHGVVSRCAVRHVHSLGAL
jgi:hypothetical protein